MSSETMNACKVVAKAMSRIPQQDQCDLVDCLVAMARDDSGEEWAACEKTITEILDNPTGRIIPLEDTLPENSA